MKPIRVLIADDHSILRAGLRLLINSQADMVVVCEAENWDTTYSQLVEYSPDVATVDLSMPGGDPFIRLRQLKQLSTMTKLVVLTMHEDVAYFRAAVAAGADGYVAKTAADDQLMNAIRSVMAGRVYTTIELPTASTSNAGHILCGTCTDAPELTALSSREQEVLQGAARGLTNREMARNLFLSVKTVESYRARLMTKLGIKSRADLVKYAVRHGMLTEQP